jgi:hypothetical protein
LKSLIAYIMGMPLSGLCIIAGPRLRALTLASYQGHTSEPYGTFTGKGEQ